MKLLKYKHRKLSIFVMLCEYFYENNVKVNSNRIKESEYFILQHFHCLGILHISISKLIANKDFSFHRTLALFSTVCIPYFPQNFFHNILQKFSTKRFSTNILLIFCVCSTVHIFQSMCKHKVFFYCRTLSNEN